MRRYPEPKSGPHTGWSPGRDRAAQQRFRDALMARANGICEYPGCGSTEGLQAHHTQPGYTEDCGILVCKRHHRALDRHAR